MGSVKYRSVKSCSTKVLKRNLVLRCSGVVFFSGCDSWLFEGVERQKAEELLALPSNRVGSFMVRESARERGEKKQNICSHRRLQPRPVRRHSVLAAPSSHRGN